MLFFFFNLLLQISIEIKFSIRYITQKIIVYGSIGEKICLLTYFILNLIKNLFLWKIKVNDRHKIVISLFVS